MFWGYIAPDLPFGAAAKRRRKGTMIRKTTLIARTALAAALAFGTVGTAFVAAPAMAKEAAPKLSPGFVKLAGPFQTELGALQKAPDAAKANALVPKWEALAAAASTPDDKFFAGQFGIAVSQMSKNNDLQTRALQLTVDSGKVSGPELGKYLFYLGAAKINAKDFAGAQAALTKAQAAGATDPDLPALIAETYFGQNQNQAGLDALWAGIEARRAAGSPAPAEWYVRGLSIAYRGKIYDQALRFAVGNAQAYPTADNWGDALGLARTAGKYQAQETLDVMRLADRVGAMRDANDYSEYIQAADARRSPGEVLKIVNKGVTAGKLSASDVFVSDSRTQAQARLAADKASLPALERDARAPSATAATVIAAADTFLSYDEPAKAEALYQVALAKPGIDADRALTRLGIAQVDQGKYADAQATFAKVGGARKQIAQMWSIYAAQKAKGG
jgi:hypothetical protein